MPTRSGQMYFGACIDDAGDSFQSQKWTASQLGFSLLFFFFPFLRYHPCPARLVLNLIP